ncbi:MAG: carboxypeptidase-like regulatory domain-containing protein [Planctomycetota bacterium]|nr:carboxypeptidase-like regulatory domain-containing protein [Planctomycetota bacterium]
MRVEVLGSRWDGLEPHPVEEARYMGSLLPDDAPSAAVDEHGAFRIEGLRAGYVRLWFGAAEHEVHWADELAVRAGRTVEAGTLVLQPLDARGCVEGRVLDPHGQPVAGALVECARQSLRQPLFRGHSKARRTTADADGRFRIWVEPKSRYHVGAADPLERFRPVSIGTFAAGDQGVELRLAQWRPLEVLTLDAEARPIAAAKIELIDSGRAELLERETKRWNAGRLLAPWCDFEVVVHAPGCLPERLGPFSAQDGPVQVVARPGPAPLVRGNVRIDGVGAGEARVEFMLAADPARGSVTVREPGFEPFQARVAAEAARREVRASADGSFELAVPPGRAFFVRVSAPQRAALTLGPYELAAGKELELTCDLPVGGSLVGIVLRADGKSAAGTLVGVSRGDGLVATCRVDAGGRFEFRALEPGPWQVRRVAREALGFEPMPLILGGAASPRWDVTVVDGRESRFDLTLDETRRTRLGGALRFDGLSAGPWGVEARLGAQSASGVLDPDGNFELELPREGDWVLAARWSPRTGNEFEYSEPLARWSGRLSVERDWPASILEVDIGADRAGQIVSAIQSGPGAARFAVHARIDVTGVAEFSQAPAGVLRIELEDGEFLECTLAAGERRKLAWPRR